MSSRNRRRKVRKGVPGGRLNQRSATASARGVPGLGRTYLGGLLPGQVAGHLLLWGVIGLSRLSRSKRSRGWGGNQSGWNDSSGIPSMPGFPGVFTGLPDSGPVAGGGAYIGTPPTVFYPNSPPPTTLLPPTPDTYFPPYSDLVPDLPTYGPTPDSGPGSSFPETPFLSPEARLELIRQTYYSP